MVAQNNQNNRHYSLSIHYYTALHSNTHVGLMHTLSLRTPFLVLNVKSSLQKLPYRVLKDLTELNSFAQKSNLQTYCTVNNKKLCKNIIYYNSKYMEY